MKAKSQLNLYQVAPPELCNLDYKINARRPHLEAKCGHYRGDKEAVYHRVFSKARDFLNQDTGLGVPYVGLTSAYADRICKIGFSLISKMTCVENGEDFEVIKAFIDYIQEVGWRRVVEMKCVFGDMYDLNTHADNKYGIIDLDNNGFASLKRNEEILRLVNHTAANQCVLAIWNSYGMKVISEEEHIGLMDALYDQLRKTFSVNRGREFYNETFPMCCDYLLMERKN